MQLFKLQDNASTRANEYKQVLNKFMLEIRKIYFILLATKIFNADKKEWGK